MSVSQPFTASAATVRAVQLCRTAPGCRSQVVVSLCLSSCALFIYLFDKRQMAHSALHPGEVLRLLAHAAVQDAADGKVTHCVISRVSILSQMQSSAEQAYKAHRGASHCLLQTQIDAHAASKTGAWPDETPDELLWRHHSIQPWAGTAPRWQASAEHGWGHARDLASCRTVCRCLLGAPACRGWHGGKRRCLTVCQELGPFALQGGGKYL